AAGALCRLEAHRGPDGGAGGQVAVLDAVALHAAVHIDPYRAGPRVEAPDPAVELGRVDARDHTRPAPVLDREDHEIATADPSPVAAFHAKPLGASGHVGGDLAPAARHRLDAR